MTGIRTAVILAALGILVISVSLVASLSRTEAQETAEGKDRAEQRTLDFFRVSTRTPRVIERAPIPGGWLVTARNGIIRDHDISITFVPDPEHLWDGLSLQR